MTTTLKEKRPATETPRTTEAPAPRTPTPATGDGSAKEQPAPQPEARPLITQTTAPRRFNLKRLLLGAVGAAAVLGATAYGWSYWQWASAHESTDNAFIDGQIVQVSARETGHVARVNVNDNQFVKAGDVLVELDPADYQAALDEANGKLVAAQADLTAAKSAVDEAESRITAAEAAVAQAQADAASKKAELNRATADLEQYTRARDAGSLSTLEWGRAQTTQQTAQAAFDASDKAVAAAQAQVLSARAAAQSRRGQVAVAQAQIVSAQATLDKAKLNLSYTKITASTDGRVTRKSVEPGNFVIPGQPLFALVSPDVWVTANFKETQLREMKPGQKVEVEVDAYPGLKLEGHVDSIQQGSGARFSLLPPENATGNYVKVVQRVPVKIVLDTQNTGGHILGPGMSVVPVVTLHDKDNAGHDAVAVTSDKEG